MTQRRRRRRDRTSASVVTAVLAALVVLVGCTSGTTGGTGTGTSTAPHGPPTSPVASATPSSSGRDVTLGDAGLPTLLPEAVRQRVPTRVVVGELGIDLPVVLPATGESGRFPWCNVAEFLPSMSRPGRPGATFIYAHARDGMFLPILLASRVRDGEAMQGARIDVFSSDDRRFGYEVVQVLRHVVSLDFAYRETAEQLILQTSEGAGPTVGKTMLVARPIGEEPASREDAHPAASPVSCG